MPNVVPVKTLVLVFVALLALLALTLSAAQIEHGLLNLLVGLTIGFAKTTLIVLFFMHLRHNPFVVRVFAMAGFLWLAIMISLTMSDYLTRL